jgi:uncharacterized OB-fold protein
MAEHDFELFVCGDCGNILVDAAEFCPACLSDRVAPCPASARATLESMTHVRIPAPQFASSAPVFVGVVRLEASHQLASGRIMADGPPPHIGGRVRLTRDDRGSILIHPLDEG